MDLHQTIREMVNAGRRHQTIRKTVSAGHQLMKEKISSLHKRKTKCSQQRIG
jgi:hypothetical protein